MKVTWQAIKDLSSALRRPIATLIALSHDNDPFYLGVARQRDAEWFAALYAEHGFRRGVHLRRIHYRFVSQETPIELPTGGAYLNTENCWVALCEAAKSARYAGLVDINDFADQRNPEPIEYLPDVPDRPQIHASNGGLCGLEIPTQITNPWLMITDGYVCPTHYHVEIWAEKSTVNDVLDPLAERYKMNLQTGLGEMSLSRCRGLVRRATANGGRPVRIIYVSDFDPAGQSMPVAAARKIEWLAQDEGVDLQLHPIILTHDQCVEYRLPRTPIKETERRGAGFEERFGEGATELDALEALHPGVMRQILVREIERFHDPDFARSWRAAIGRAQGRLDEITREILARHATEESALLERLDALREEASELEADVDARGEEIARELHIAARNIELDLPEPADADEWPDPLFDSTRDYVEQMDRYKAFQGRPIGRIPHGAKKAAKAARLVRSRRMRSRNV